MATIASIAAGNWSAAGTWTGGAIPGAGDIAQINHAVTVDSNRTIGTSAVAGVDAITVAAGAGVILTVATGVLLQVRGDLRVKGPASAAVAKWGLVINGTGEVRFDPSAAAAPTTTQYQLILGDTVQARVGLKMAGTSKTNRAKLTTALGGGGTNKIAAVTRGAQTKTGYLDLTNALIQHMDRFDQRIDASAIAVCKMTEVIVDDCAEFPYQSAANGLAAVVLWTNVTWSNPRTSCFHYNGNANTGGAMKGIVVMGDSDLLIVDGLTIGGTGVNDWCYFHTAPTVTNSGAPWALFRNVFCRHVSQYVLAGGIQDVFIWSEGNINNPHFAIFPTGGDYDILVQRVQVEADNTVSNGDIFLLQTGAAPTRTRRFRNVIVLPNASDISPGTLITDTLGDPDRVADIEHCTYCTALSDGVSVGETTPAPAGKITSLRSNLVYRLTSGVGKVFFDWQERSTPGTGTMDALVAGMANHNCLYNVTPATAYEGQFSVAPGANDINVNPQLVDITVDLGAFDLANGGPGTGVNARTELAKKNDASGYNGAYNLPALLTFIEQGFTPQNNALQGTAHDGGDIGAVAVAAAAPSLSTPVITNPTPGQVVDSSVTVQWTASV